MSGSLVWLASYPKSGNTWFRAVLTACLSGGDVELNALHSDETAGIASAVARFEESLGVTSSLLHRDEVERYRPLADDVVSDRASGPLVCKIHDSLAPVPDGGRVVSVDATRCAVYVVRDPRDVAVSYSHHSRRDMERVVQWMNDPGHGMAGRRDPVGSQFPQRLGTWSSHVRSWLDDPPFPVHVVRYEDCLDDPVPTFAAAIRSAGFEVADDAVARAVERSSFEVLSAQESENGFHERPLGMDRFFRRGQAGAWRDELPADLAATVAADHHEVMARLGYLDDGPTAPADRIDR